MPEASSQDSVTRLRAVLKPWIEGGESVSAAIDRLLAALCSACSSATPGECGFGCEGAAVRAMLEEIRHGHSLTDAAAAQIVRALNGRSVERPFRLVAPPMPPVAVGVMGPVRLVDRLRSLGQKAVIALDAESLGNACRKRRLTALVVAVDAMPAGLSQALADVCDTWRVPLVAVGPDDGPARRRLALELKAVAYYSESRLEELVEELPGGDVVRKGKVLLAGGDRPMLAYFGALSDRAGFDCLLVDDVDSLFTALPKFLPDTVVLDDSLDMPASEVAELLRLDSRVREVPVVVVAGEGIAGSVGVGIVERPVVARSFVGALVAHTERYRSFSASRSDIAAERARNRLLAAAFDSAGTGMMITETRDGVLPIMMANEAFVTLTGYDAGSVRGRTPGILLGPETEEGLAERLRKAIDAGESLSQEILAYRRNGEAFWAELRLSPVGGGRDGGNYVWTLTDITRRVEDARAFRHVNRLLEVAMACDAAVVRMPSEESLFVEICRVLTEIGGYSFAWVGVLAGNAIRPAAYAGGSPPGFSKGEHLPEQIARVWSESDATLSCREAVRKGKLHLVRDIAAECSGQCREEALNGGMRSLLALPMVRDGRVMGVVAIYASSSSAFADDEVDALAEMVGDLAVGVRARQLARENEEALRHLRESEDRLNRVFALIPDALIVSRLRDGTMVSANRAFFDITGLDPAAAIGHTAHTLGIWPDPNSRERMVRKVQNEGRLKDYETTVLQRSGASRDVVMSAECLEIGGETHLLAVIHDITERKQRERELSYRHKRLQKTAAELERQKFTLDQHAIVSAADPFGNIVYVNDKFCEVGGYRRDELVGQNHRVLNSGYHSREFFAEMWATIASGEVWHGVICNRSRDGRLYWVDSTIVPFVDEKGKPYRYVSARTDITERVQAEERLRLGKATSEALGQILALALAADEEEEILARALATVLAVPCFAGVPRGAIFLMDKEGRLELRSRQSLPSAAIDRCGNAALKELIDGGSLPTSVSTFTPASGLHRPCRFPELEGHGHYAVPIVCGGLTRGVLLVYLDAEHRHNLDEVNFLEAVAQTIASILERKRVDRQLVEAKDAAEQASRAKSEFLSRMSHELRTPMNAILGFAQLLQSDPNEPLAPGQEESVEQILSAGWHLLDLINEVLDLSRIEAGRLQLSLADLRLDELVDECLALVEPLASRHEVALAVAGCEGLAVRGDRLRVKQVLLNLLSNAIKYNRASGKVDINCESADGMARVMVRDTGVGIAAADIELLFQPFQRLGAEELAIEGSGIGLTITRRFIELMGGRIDVESTEGVGTTFRFTLPLGGQAQAEAAELPPEEGVVGGKRVLYVEDNQENVRLLERIMASRPDLDLISVPDGSMGLELARAMKPDLVLLDLTLPGLSGYEVLEALKRGEETRAIPIAALTASDSAEDIRRGLAAGFDRYLTKPVDIDGLMAMLDDMLGRAEG